MWYLRKVKTPDVVKNILLIAALLGLLAGQVLSAQVPHFNIHEFGERFGHTQVNVLYECQESILWVGSSKGLFLYDGQSFRSHLLPDTFSNVVTALFQDEQRKLWVGYEDGTIANLSKQELVPVSTPEIAISSPISGFAQDQTGRLWIATYGQGVYYQEQEQWQSVSSENHLLSDHVYALVKDPKEAIWLATDSGVNICVFDEGQLKVSSLTRADGLPDEIVKDILVDPQGNIWLGTFDKGICYFDWQVQEFHYPTPPAELGEVTSLEIFDQQELWIGTDGHGLWRYQFSSQTFHPVQVDDQKIGSKVYDLCKDVEGNLWVVSNENGIAQTNRQFSFLTTDFENIQAVLTDRNNTLWIGTQNGLFTFRDDRQPAFQDQVPELQQNVLSLYEDQYGVIWIGTFGNGVFCYEPGSGKLKRLTEANGLTNNSVLSIDGQKGHIWLATLGGVTEFEIYDNIFNIPSPRFHSFNRESGLGTNYTYHIFIDSRERVWFASDGKGVSVLDQGAFTNYTHAIVRNAKDSLRYVPLKAVYSIAEDDQQKIWLSTAGQGVFELKDTAFYQLGVMEGIQNLEVTSLIRDKKDNILVVHSTGIDILDPRKHHLIYYGKEVGIEQIDPNLNAVCTDQRGNIWIAGQRQLIRYTPLQENLEIHPRTLINQVAVFLEPLDFSKKQSLAHHQNNLVFDYMGVWYTNPHSVKYRYQLEGYGPCLDLLFRHPGHLFQFAAGGLLLSSDEHGE